MWWLPHVARYGHHGCALQTQVRDLHTVKFWSYLFYGKDFIFFPKNGLSQDRVFSIVFWADFLNFTDYKIGFLFLFDWAQLLQSYSLYLP